MNSAGCWALTTGLPIAALAASALFRLRAGLGTIPILLYSVASMLSTLFPLQLILLATAMLAWSTFLGATQTVGGWIGHTLGGLGIGALVFIIVRQFNTRNVFDRALRQALGHSVSADDLPSTRILFWSLLRPLSLRTRGVERICDLPYGPEGIRNLLDIYRPCDVMARGNRLPVLIQAHGSAWMVGNKNNQALPLIYHMARNGWIIVSINYRLSPAAHFPAHLDDVQHAIAWVWSHIAQYGGDPNFIALTGGSAGAHLVSLAALNASRRNRNAESEAALPSIKAVVPIYGRYDFLGRDEHPVTGKAFIRFLARYIMPGPPEAMPGLWELASPVSQVHANAPPFFVIQGSYDSIVPVAGARIFTERLRAISKAVVAYAELPGLQHGFDIVRSPATEFTIRAVRCFLDAQYHIFQSGSIHAETSAEENHECI